MHSFVDRKQTFEKLSLYFTEEEIEALSREAKRLDRTRSWVLRTALKLALERIRAIPGPHEVIGGTS